MNIISGVYHYGNYEGDFYFNGERCQFKSVNDSVEKGIAIIHQHLALVPLLTIAENIFLGNEQAKNGVIDWQSAWASGSWSRSARQSPRMSSC